MTIENDTPQPSEKPTRRRRPRRREKDVHRTLHVDGSAQWSKLQSPDPGMKYIWANAASDEVGCGAEYFKSLGYEEVRRTGDRRDPKPYIGERVVKKGEVYQTRGLVLMEIPLEDWEDLQEYGEDGNTGQAWADRMEQLLNGNQTTTKFQEILGSSRCAAAPDRD